MSRNLWRALFVVFVAAWALYELYPLESRDLIDVFEASVETPDETFYQIVNQARQLEQQDTNQAFGALWLATGTNNLANYFPSLYDDQAEEPNREILNRLQMKAAGSIKLGLDLKGGVSFLVSLDASKLQNVADRAHAQEQAIEVLRSRVDRFGVAEPIIQPAGEDRILIQLPGLSEAQRDSARTQIQRAAFLEFRLVHPESAELVREGIPMPGYELKALRRKRGEEPAEPVVYLVKKVPEEGLTGKYIERAGVSPDPMTGLPRIDFQFNGKGASVFANVTRQHQGEQLAIILDGELYSAPVIRTPILGGIGVIEGDFDVAEAYELANVLVNPLEAPVSIEEERSVDPSLGRDSIRSGIKAGLIGAVTVCLFMLVYYIIAGVVANVALMLNIILLLGVLCSVDATLTLPGIAGIVLTIGMAVDANVLIYERIREESATGKSLRGAIASGYEKAFGTILDSNVTTLIASIILIFMGTGPVQGFGVTLTIGIAVSLFTALVVTRLIFDSLLAKGWLRKLKMFQIIRGSKIQFMNVAVPAFIASWALIAVGNGYGLYRGKQILGPDFAGGDLLGLRFEEKIETGRVREAVTALGVGEPLIQYQTDLSTGKETLQVVSAEGSGQQVYEAIKAAFPEAGFERISLDQVGAAVGREIQKSAVIATLLALFGILVYVAFRYEFSFAIAAVIATSHDVLMTMGWFFLTGRELSAPIVAAVLTIIGFSINDTIVIFDRIREDLKLGARGTFREVITKALNQTLSRTVITSGTSLLAAVSLYIFGGGVINDFAFTYMVGILTGTYSSIYIASATVLWWHRGKRPQLGSQVALEGQPAPAT
jgi:SecD/SecF fusion protein